MGVLSRSELKVAKQYGLAPVQAAKMKATFMLTGRSNSLTAESLDQFVEDIHSPVSPELNHKAKDLIDAYKDSWNSPNHDSFTESFARALPKEWGNSNARKLVNGARVMLTEEREAKGYNDGASRLEELAERALKGTPPLNKNEVIALQGGMRMHGMKGANGRFLGIDGHMGRQTQTAAAKFLEEKRAMNFDDTNNLSTPLNNSQTRILQGTLNTLGYDTGKIDGVAGRKTQRALQQLKEDTGIDFDPHDINQETLKKISDHYQKPENRGALLAKAEESITGQNANAASIKNGQASLNVLGHYTRIDGIKDGSTLTNIDQEKQAYRDNDRDFSNDFSPDWHNGVSPGLDDVPYDDQEAVGSIRPLIPDTPSL